MRGKKAKKLRLQAYATTVEGFEPKRPTTPAEDIKSLQRGSTDIRYLYQALKGRKAFSTGRKP